MGNNPFEELFAEQKASMGNSGGIIIDNKHFTKGDYHIIRRPDAPPGSVFVSFYSKSANGAHSASPSSYGVACPILDMLEELKAGGNETKENRDFAYGICKPSREYWMGVIPVDDPGTPEEPNIKILRGKLPVYQSIMNFMVDEDKGHDIMDVITGRPVLVKKVPTPDKQFSAEWTTIIGDVRAIASPDADVDDNELREAIVARAETFDPANYFFSVDWENLSKIYTTMFGVPIPQHYKDEWDEYAEEHSDTSAAPPVAKAPPRKDKAVKPVTKKAPTCKKASDIEFGVTRCTFPAEDEEGNEATVAGVITGEDPAPEEEGLHYLVADDDEPDGEPWSVLAEDVTLEAKEVSPKKKRRSRKPSAGKSVRGA